jgi:hypothetical protein
MRLTLLTIALLAAGGGTYYFGQDKRSSFQEAFIALADQRPDILNTYATKAVDHCIAIDKGRSISQNVRAIASASLVRTMLLVAKGKTQAQVSDDMITWATKRVKPLAESEQRQYFDLMPVLLDSTVPLCVMDQIRGSGDFWLAHKSASWDIRS